MRENEKAKPIDAQSHRQSLYLQLLWFN